MIYWLRWSCFCVVFAIYAEPPREIPQDLYDQYTLNGTIPVLSWYLDGSQDALTSRYYSKQTIDALIEKVKRGEENYYASTDTWLYSALKNHPIEGKSVAIIGSVEPWYESVVLAFGGHPVTIEYNKIWTDDPRVTVMTVDEYEKNPIQFDVVLSISSTEHDGLGRYGDPLNPNGDLDFMAKVKNQMLKSDGFLILAVPIGRDCLVWNAHRIYGTKRFSLLREGWNIVASFGFYHQAMFGALGNQGYQPVFVMTPLL